jgi:hypothetical protein
MTDLQFAPGGAVITTVAGYYALLYGSWLLLARSNALPLRGESPMVDTTDPLVLDLVEWIAKEPRLYSRDLAHILG